MSDRIYAGIITSYNAAGLNTSIGTLYSIKAGGKASWPHTVQTVISDTPEGYSSSRSYRRVMLTMSIKYKETTGSDPIAQGGTYNRSLISGLLGNKVSIPASEGRVLQYWLARQEIDALDEDKRIYMADTDWIFEIGHPIGTMRNVGV